MIEHHTINQEKDMLVELQRRKQLFTSLFYSTLTDREANVYISHMLMWTLAAEKMTEVLLKGLELDLSDPIDNDLTDYSELAYCAGSLVSFPHSSSTVLCYCGRRFNRRFNSRQDTWTIPKHTTQKKGNL